MAIKLDITRLQDAQERIATAIAKFGPMNVTPRSSAGDAQAARWSGTHNLIAAGISGLSFWPSLCRREVWR